MNKKEINRSEFDENLTSTQLEVAAEQESLTENVRIYVKKLPAKSTYYVGEELNLTGLEVIREKSINGVVQESRTLGKQEYAVSVLKYVSLADREIVVSYTEDKVVYTAKFSITVNEKLSRENISGLTDSNVNHSKLSFACGAGNADINVYNGRLLFESPDIFVGLNSYETAVTHIYDSYYCKSIDGACGKGWKLSIQQYLQESNELDDNGRKVFYYKDTYGYVHIFEHYDVLYKDNLQYSKYFDRTGLGLTLFFSATDVYIEDRQGAKMYFVKINGVYKLKEAISGYSVWIKKVIDYDEAGNIIAYYDVRKPDRKFAFSYNEQGLLSRIECAASKQITEYRYNAKRELISVRKTVNASVKDSVYYVYQTDGKENLAYAINLQDGSSIKFTYYQSNIIKEAQEGYYKPKCGYSGLRKALWSNCGGFAGIGQYCGQEENPLLTFNSDKIASEFKVGANTALLIYNNNETSVQNKKGITNVFFLNQKGFTVSILEQDKYRSYRTPFKENGYPINVGGTGEKINGDGAVSVSETYSFSDAQTAAFKKFLELDRNAESSNFILSFWVKLNSAQSKTVRAKFKYRYYKGIEREEGQARWWVSQDDYDGVYSCVLDGTAVGVWQHVSIPVELSLKSNRMLPGDGCTLHVHIDFKKLLGLEFENLTNGCDITDLHFVAEQNPSLKFVKSHENYKVSLALTDAETIKYKKSTRETENLVGKDFFMADSDVVATAQNMCKAKSLNSTEFDFIYNGGTKRISRVTEVSFVKNTVKFSLDVIKDSSQAYYPLYVFAIEPYVEANKNFTIVSYRLTNGEIKQICTHITAFIDSSFSNGKYTETYKYEDRFGNTLKEIDAYGLTKTYTYDTYGNLVKTVLSGKDTTETIVTTNTYDSSGEKLIKTVSPTSRIESDANPLSGVIQSQTELSSDTLSANKAEYAYNEAKENLTEVKLTVNGVEYGKNILTYDKDGRLKEAYPSSDCKYGFEYDVFGRNTKFLLNGVTILSKEYRDGENAVNVCYHRSSSEIDTISTVCDNYGKIVNVTSGSKSLKLTYQGETNGCNESLSLANISTMEDGFSGQTFNYKYDSYTGQPTQYSITDGEETVTVKCIENNKVAYTFKNGDLNFDDEIKYDENCLITPRVVRTSNNNVAGVEWDFEYDGLGRCIKRYDTFFALKTQLPTLTKEYQTGTFLANKLEYKANSGKFDVIVRQSYDGRKNVKNIRLSQVQNGTEINLVSNDYTYDDLNRLTKEVVVGKKSFTKEYSYNSFGALAKKKENGTEFTYEYKAGRLTAVYQNGRREKHYSYDSFGNPVSFNYYTQNMWWERGTLLKKFGNISYVYDSEGKLVRRDDGTRTRKLYYDGDKLIAEKISNIVIRYFYDLDGVAGFKIGQEAKYHYVKDAQGNVIALSQDSGSGTKIIAYYTYDAFGKASVVDSDGNEITAWNNAAVLNPFRWKSQYIDSDTGLYYISKRWYDPECGRFINAASPECLLDNASVVFALNLYAFAIENPIAVILACGSIYPSLDFFYEGPAPWWENAWNWVLFGLGVLLTIAAAIIAGVAAGPGFAAVSAVWLTLKNIAVATVAGAALSLTIGGTIAGLQGAMTGHAFWSGFLRYAKNNAAEALISSFAVSAASVAIGNAINALKCFKEGTPVVTEEGLKPIEEVKVGDKVLAYDEATGEQAYKKVVRLFRNKTDEWYHITANGEEIVCTGGHPFYVLNASEDRNAIRFDDREETNGKWITAKELKKDDKLLLSDGSYGIIKSIKVEKLSEPETTYNFEVADFHTYFVGTNEVLVHNACLKFDNVEIRQANKADFTDEAWDRIQSLAKDADGNTISSIKDGKAIHKGFMVESRGYVNGGGSNGGKGFFDGYDKARRIVYELKPNNPASIKRGVAQLLRYQKALMADAQKIHKLVLVVY